MKFLSKQRTIADIYSKLRGKALTINPSQIGLQPDQSRPVFGLLMETGYKDSVATLSAIGDGTVSLYFSNGGGIIGLGDYQRPRDACFSFLSQANEFISQMKPTKKFPLPEEGRVIFYLLTINGVLMSNAKENDLIKKRHPLSPLYHKAHEVITEARLVDEQRKRDIHELLNAATRGDVSKLKLLIDKDINLNVSDETGLTALMSAAHKGHVEILELLLYAGVSVDAKDSLGYTALMFSCNSGNLSCAKYLIDNGANVNEADNDGSTPIMFCAQHGYNDVVRLLLEKGADPTIKGTHGLSAISFAEQNSLIETVKILQEK